ncbi:hypothetical protein SBBP1_150004 [Burkholderiales bacterium]|nr:hypothetical protein SBBP1_150004 [Burkholderiales bacterium]
MRGGRNPAVQGWHGHAKVLGHVARRHAIAQEQLADDALFQYLSPSGWEHINLTSDYLWRGARIGAGRFRPLRTMPTP